MIRKNWLFAGSILLALMFASCNQDKEIFGVAELIKGKATTIIITSSTTEINLEDYVLVLSDIDSITAPAELQIRRDGSKVFLDGEMKSWLGNLQLWHQGFAYQVPLRKKNQSKMTIHYTGPATDVRVKGEFNAWNPASLEKADDGYSISFNLTPGNYQYVFVLDGKEKRDYANPDSVDNGMGSWNSVIRIPKPDPSSLPFIETTSYQNEIITLTIQRPAEQVMVYWENFLISEKSVKVNGPSVNITIPDQAKDKKRTYIRVWASNKEGISNDVLIPLDHGKVLSDVAQLQRTDKEAQVLYFLMVDRFMNGNKENDEPVKDKSIHPKANYYGGDLAGVIQKIKDGYFKEMAINTLWLSPITQNPKGAYGKYPNPPTTFSGYHGYWPVSFKQIDYRFGTKEELDELIHIAHEQNINVILDYVAHHIHQEHPLFKEHPEWFTSLYLPDGSLNTERWDDHRLTTWFDVFLPTFDLSKPEVVGPMTDTAMYWLEQSDLDGFRHDASKHIDLLFWRELTRKVKSRIDRPVFQIGETYGSRELVQSYVNTGMLDGQFDFNVYDDAVSTFARDETPFSRLANSITESIDWFGHHNLMGYVSGNQDRARFISYADGSIRFDEDAKKAGWTRNIELQDTLAHKKLRSLMAFNMTIPGVPVIYYADEIGDPGGNDPDNRRMMRFDKLSPPETYTRTITQRLTTLRRNNLALQYGDFKIIQVTDHQFVYCRKYFNQEIIVAFNKSPQEAKLSLGELTGDIQNYFSGQLTLAGNASTLLLKPYSFEIISVLKK